MPVDASVAALTTHSALPGLRSGQVEIVEHHPAWAGLFSDVAPAIHDVLGGANAQVEHIGSTSVPGLAAKPLIDIAVGIPPPIKREQVIQDLTAIGFEFQEDLGNYGGLFFTVCAAPEIAVCHLHVVGLDNFQWRWYLAFRDALRADPGLRREYEHLKRRAATEHPTSRQGYTQAKADWVITTLTDLAGPPTATG